MEYAWFKEAKYGMMIHWGLYSLLGGEYGGRRITKRYAEWIQANLAIPVAEYERLAAAFNPVFFDADEIVGVAKACGMRSWPQRRQRRCCQRPRRRG